MNDKTAINPLIQENPLNTISHCADVIDYMAYFNENDAGEPNDDIRNGGFLIFYTVTQALRYEIGRVHGSVEASPAQAAAASGEGEASTLGSNLDMINNVQARTTRARATADLLTTYFQQIDHCLSEILDETVEASLNTIIHELDAIDRVVDTTGEPERVQPDDVCVHIGHARATADLLLAYFQKVSQALADVHYETVEASLAGIIHELDAIRLVVSPEVEALS